MSPPVTIPGGRPQLSHSPPHPPSTLGTGSLPWEALPPSPPGCPADTRCHTAALCASHVARSPCWLAAPGDAGLSNAPLGSQGLAPRRRSMISQDSLRVRALVLLHVPRAGPALIPEWAREPG